MTLLKDFSVTLDEAADTLNVSKRRVVKMIRNRELLGFRATSTVGGWRISRTHLNEVAEDLAA